MFVTCVAVSTENLVSICKLLIFLSNQNTFLSAFCRLGECVVSKCFKIVSGRCFDRSGDRITSLLTASSIRR